MSLPTFPCHPSEVHQKLGISTIAFNNPDGHLVATKNDSMPTTVWIWSLKLLRPYAVLVHLSTVKSIQWHATIPDLLMILCANEDDARGSGVVYLWSSRWKQPRAIVTPIERISGHFWAKWLYTPKPSNSATASNGTSGSSSTGSLICDRRSRTPEESDKKPTIMFGDRDGFALGYVEDEVIEDSGIMGGIPEDDSMDKRAWNPKEWAFSSPIQQQQTPSHSNHSYGINNGLSNRGGLGSVMSQSPHSDSSRKSKNEDEEYRQRRHVSVKS